ncbi:MAG: NusG domain II-containing protein [Ruminococcus sp.]|nr:NusG domain II-containing protein [Ruminococcus sp.]
MKTRTWIIVLSSAVIVFAIWWLFISNSLSPSKIVGIYQNGNLVEKIDLNSVTGEREITLSGEFGKNVVLVSHGHIEMKSAECPDKICVKHGALEKSGTPIVCLPNKVVIQFEDTSDDVDAKTGVAG